MTDERPAEPTPDQTPEAVGDYPATEDATMASAGTGAPGASDEQASGWSTSSTEDVDAESTGAKMVSQLQAMIDSIATQAAPAARQIGIKAAELTAAAAERAAPIAHKAGDAAADASGKLALRSREFAEAMRRELGASGNGSAAPGESPAEAGGTDASSAATAVLDQPVDEVVDDVNRRADEAG